MFKFSPLMLALAASPAFAQTTLPAAQLAPVVVTGNPLRLPQADAQSLSGAELRWRRASTLGETLDGLPGVSATGFGPQASRPILRGLDGDRLRILANGGGVLDASSLSFDHAVALDPLVVERIELLRGPAALLYGGQALGGVVNSLDNRIPQGGRGAAVETRVGGASQERAISAVFDGGPDAGQAGWAWHGDFSRRLSDNQRSPHFIVDGESQREVRNSDGSQRSGAVGLGYVGAQGHAGLSVDDYRNDYGVTAEPDVRIRMQRQRVAQAGEWRWSDGLVRRIRWQASGTRYAHDEVEGSGEVGTQFRLRGHDARVELEHAPLGGLRGVVGLQLEQQRFSALGEEAFVPNTRSRHQAAFVFEQWQQGAWQLSGGARLEDVRQDSRGDADDGEAPRFGPARSRSFQPRSLAAQLAWQASPAWRWQLQLSDSERAPTHYELYANGVHVATAAFERGDAALGLERARGVEASLQFRQQDTLLQLNLHQQRFGRFIALQDTGAEFETEEGEQLPIYAFQAVPARLSGWELQAEQRLHGVAGGALKVQAQLDGLRAENRATGEPLPRIAPGHVRLSADWERGAWALRVGLTHALRQDRPGPGDTPTAGHTRVDAGLAYRFRLGGVEGLWALKGQNLGNRLAYSSSTIATLRALSPLPGRSWHSSLLLRF